MRDRPFKQRRSNSATRRVAVGVAMVAMVVSMPRASAESSKTAPSPKADSHERPANAGDTAQALSSQVNDPTAPISLIQFREILVPSVPGAEGPANVFEIQPVLPISASHRIPFDQLMKITLPLVTTPGPGRTTGLGDFQVFDLVSLQQSWGRWGLGPTVVFPTATSDALGQGKWQAGPAAAIMMTAVDHLQVGAVFQNPISFAGDSSRESVNALTITPTLTYNMPGGWFGGSSDFDWIFDWENDGAATIPLGIQLGKVFALGSMPFSFSVEGAYNVVRPSDGPEWLVGFELNWILSRPSRPD